MINITDDTMMNSDSKSNFLKINRLSIIEEPTFNNSNFNNIPDDFYKGWDGKDMWEK